MKRMDQFKRILSVMLCAVQLLLLLSSVQSASAASAKTFYMVQSQRLALSNSAELSKQYNKIILKQMKYIEAVKAIQAKIKNLTSFRYSPLLSFKFPEKLNLTEEYELNIKPLNLQAEITTLQHGLADMKYKVLAEVNKAYLSAYGYQEKIAFTQEMLDSAQAELARNKARIVTGEASQDDIEKMEKSVKTITSDLSLLKRSFETAKSELKDLTKLDVTSGYRFANPLKTADISRASLDSIITYTLKNDQGYYEAKMAASSALMTLNFYDSLMRGQYGSKVNIISTFESMARQGKDIDYAAFQLKYNEMLKNVDAPWTGSYRILFIRIPKEWFKGEISGTRYIEEEMYAIYTACQDYGAALKEQQAAEKSLRKEVTANFEALVTTKNAYKALAGAVASTKEDLTKLVALNKLGKAEYSEVKDKQTDYQEIQLELIDALSTYNELLYSFDRLTCGAITKLLNGESISTDAGQSGDSYANIDQIDEPYYYIYTDVENLLFVFGVNIPEDYQPEMTHFEIWYGKTQIGERTPLTKQLRHLALDYGDSYTLTVRFYKDDTYVDECEIDTTVARDVLKLKGAVPVVAETGKPIGSYAVETNAYGTVSTSVLTLKVDAGLAIKYFSLSNESGTSIYSKDLISVDSKFTYLTLLIASLDTVKLTFYDSGKNAIYTAHFDTSAQKIMALISQ